MKLTAIFTTKNSLLLGLLLLASVTRFYRLPSTYLYQGDQGRDVLLMRALLVDHQPIFLGPTTSLGHYYLGPFFYYLSAPSLIVSGLNPVGPALFQALLGTLTVGLLYLFARKILSPRSSLIVGLLGALLPTLITYSRFAWNPNPSPLFALLFLWSFYTFLMTKKSRWFVTSVILASGLWQLHYVLLVFGLALLPAGLVWLQQKYPLKNYVASLMLVAPFLGLALLPLVASWYKSLSFAAGDTTSLLTVKATTPLIFGQTYGELFTSMLPTTTLPLSTMIILMVATSAMVLTLITATQKATTTLFKDSLTLFWSSITLVVLTMVSGLSIINGNREIHYFLGFYPLILLLFGQGLDWLCRRLSVVQQTLVTTGFTALFIVQALLCLPPLFQSTSLPAVAIDSITRDIQALSSDQPFNFALIAQTNERNSYDYFFTLNQVHAHSSTVTNQIFIVCENEPCQINGHPDWQIAQFEATHVNAVNYREMELPGQTGEYPKLFRGTVKGSD